MTLYATINVFFVQIFHLFCILNKYFFNKLKENLVILIDSITEAEEMFKMLEKEVSEISSDIACSYFDTDREWKSEVKHLLQKPEQIICLKISIIDDFDEKCFDFLSVAINVLIFTDAKYWSKEMLHIYIGKFINIRTKFALVTDVFLARVREI